MASNSVRLPSRLVVGALAGTVATAPMTSSMYRLHRRLGRRDRYPLPPREITSSVAPSLNRESAPDVTMVAHFAYGAMCGAGIAALSTKSPGVARGVAGGVAIWLASYLGWIPAFGVLKPVTEHPTRRNGLMILSHMVWGAAFAVANRELTKGRSIFVGAPLKDLPEER